MVVAVVVMMGASVRVVLRVVTVVEVVVVEVVVAAMAAAEVKMLPVTAPELKRKMSSY